MSFKIWGPSHRSPPVGRRVRHGDRSTACCSFHTGSPWPSSLRPRLGRRCSRIAAAAAVTTMGATSRPATQSAIEDVATVIYNELGLYRPACEPNSAKQTVDDYDPASVTELNEARKAVGQVYLNRKRSGTIGGTAPPTPPSADALKNPDVQREWEAAKTAARQVVAQDAAGRDPTSGARHYLLRQAEPLRQEAHQRARTGRKGRPPVRVLGRSGNYQTGAMCLPAKMPWLDVFTGIR